MADHDLIIKQHDQRCANHPHSEQSKAPLAQMRATHPVEVGDLVYIYSDQNKSRARDRYLVVSTDGLFCNIRKFVGSQLRSTSYRVKKSECYSVPAEVLDNCSHPRLQSNDDSSADEEGPPRLLPSLPTLPDIPQAYPAMQCIPDHADCPIPGSSELPLPPPPAAISHSATQNTPDSAYHTTPSSSELLPRLDHAKAGLPPDHPTRPTRRRQRPARYDDYITDF